MRSPFLTLFLTTTLCDAFPFYGVRLFSETFFSMHLACTHTSSSHARHFRAKLRRKRVFLRGGGRRRSWPIIDENSASNLNYVHFFIEAASIKSSKTSSRTSRPRRHFWVINRGSFVHREALTQYVDTYTNTYLLACFSSPNRSYFRIAIKMPKKIKLTEW